MIITIGSDHRGFELKYKVSDLLIYMGHDVIDIGTDSSISTDYPIYAEKVAQNIITGKAEMGILLCGSGLGMSMAANRYKGIRAALCTSREQIISSRHHNNANVLVLSAEYFSFELISQWITIWLEETFDGERHIKRIDLLDS